PYTWTMDSTPPGFSLDPNTGILSGTALTSASYSFNVFVRDAFNQTASRALTLVTGNAITITNGVLKTGSVGVTYSENLFASGGTPPYQWQITDGTIPGVNVDFSTGVLAGTPILTGVFSVNIKVTDSVGQTATKAFSVTINQAFTISPDTL